MRIPSRTRRVMGRVASVLAIALVIFVLAWLCWVLWLQRYVVYIDGGAKLDFSQSSYEMVGRSAGGRSQRFYFLQRRR